MNNAVVFSALGSGSGCALRARNLAKGLAQRGWEARCVVPPFSWLPLSLETLASIPQFAWAALRSDAELAVAIKPYPNCWLALWILKLRGARVVMDVDDLDGAYRGGVAGALVTMCQAPAFWLLDHFSTHHPDLAEVLRERHSLAAGCVSMLEQGVDTSVFSPCRKSTRGKRLIFTAHLNVACQLELLMSWIAPLLAEDPEIHLVIAGGGPLLGRYQGRFSSASTSFSGPASPTQIHALTEESDLCLAAFSDELGNRFRVPMKVGEYLAQGKPVVTNLIPGLLPLKPFLYLSKPEGASYRRLVKGLLMGRSDGREAKGMRWVRRHRSLEAVAGSFVEALP
jgi:hypothetical protein